MLANRLSFVLGTVGPSMTVDTACSSSLVALRQACLHLTESGVEARGGRAPVALVGGVNLLLAPGPFDLLSKVGFFIWCRGNGIRSKMLSVESMSLLARPLSVPNICRD